MLMFFHAHNSSSIGNLALKPIDKTVKAPAEVFEMNPHLTTKDTTQGTIKKKKKRQLTHKILLSQFDATTSKSGGS